MPPFIVFTAGGGTNSMLERLGDLGLEHDAERFVALLRRCGVPTQHHTIPDCNHASICWAPAAHAIAASELRAMTGP